MNIAFLELLEQKTDYICNIALKRGYTVLMKFLASFFLVQGSACFIEGNLINHQGSTVIRKEKTCDLYFNLAKLDQSPTVMVEEKAKNNARRSTVAKGYYFLAVC